MNLELYSLNRMLIGKLMVHMVLKQRRYSNIETFHYPHQQWGCHQLLEIECFFNLSDHLMRQILKESFISTMMLSFLMHLLCSDAFDSKTMLWYNELKTENLLFRNIQPFESNHFSLYNCASDDLSCSICLAFTNPSKRSSRK